MAKIKSIIYWLHQTKGKVKVFWHLKVWKIAKKL
nr:MAG TPA: hypothetical protein [Caudoviricetes sp.]